MQFINPDVLTLKKYAKTYKKHYFVLAGIPLAVKSIDLDWQLNSTVKPYVGGTGSYTARTGRGGKSIQVQAVVLGASIKDIIRLKSKDTPVPLVSPSKGGYNGYYMVLDVKQKEAKPNFFYVDLTLQEYTPPRVTGNLVTVGDSSRMSQPNMLLIANSAALEKFNFTLESNMGRRCRANLKFFKYDYNKLFRNSPQCKKYLVGKQCWYLFKNVCHGDRSLFEHMYKSCPLLMEGY